MRKEFLVIAAVVAVALIGYLMWPSAKEIPAVQTSTPPATSAPAAPAQTPA